MTDEKIPDNSGAVDSSEESRQQPQSATPDLSPGASPADPNLEPAGAGPDEAAANTGSPDSAEDEMLKMLEDLPQDDDSGVEEIDFGAAAHDVADAEFQQLSQPAGDGEVRNIDMLMDVSLPVAIELGRTKLAISDILALGPGSVVELNRLAGEPIDVLVNNKPIARGEVVVVDENFGVRITQLLTPEERLRALGES